MPETLEDNLKHIDEIRGPKRFNQFPAGWAWAMNTPFQWTKQIASHLGGVRNPLAVSWPARIKKKGARRGGAGSGRGADGGVTFPAEKKKRRNL